MPHHYSKPKSAVIGALRVSKRLAPEQDGAKRLALRYGDQLVCVRHRLNSEGTMRYTTVELLIEQTPVIPAGTRLVALRLGHAEKSTRSLLLACGGHWDKAAKHWLAPRKVVKDLGLIDRIVSKPG